MSSASVPVKSKIQSSTRSNPLLVLVPYLVLIGGQVPFLFMYYRDLWSQPHYKFFPFAFVAFGVFLFLRWPRNSTSPFFASTFSTVLFGLGIGLGILGTLFLYAWFSAASAMCFVSSLLARTKDHQNPDRSLLAVTLPLWMTLTPFELDQWIVTTLQVFSAQISSNYLDLLGFKHYLPGTVLQFPNEQYGVEQACSGVQSLFTLLFCTSVFLVVKRRPWFRGLILLGSAVFWALFMNSVRIMSIPMADILLGLNLKEGINHDILGYTVLVIGILMMLSTDQFLNFVFGVVDEDSIDSGHPMRRSISRIWNRTVSGGGDSERQQRRKKRRATRPSNVFRIALLGAAGLFLLIGIVQIWEVQKSLSNPNLKVRVFASNVILPFKKQDLDQIITTQVGDTTYRWELGKYTMEDRERGSDFGQRSDTWIYGTNSQLLTTVSVDQSFPGWHELTRCYQNVGFILKKRTAVTPKSDDGDGEKWPFVEAEFSHKTNGESAYLIFCFTDGSGVPYSAPVSWGGFWGGIRAFVERVKNRLAHQYRKRLFRGEAYQMQVFVKNRYGRKLTEEEKEEVRVQFLVLREKIRDKLMAKSRGEDTAEESEDESKTVAANQ